MQYKDVHRKKGELTIAQVVRIPILRLLGLISVFFLLQQSTVLLMVHATQNKPSSLFSPLSNLRLPSGNNLLSASAPMKKYALLQMDIEVEVSEVDDEQHDYNYRWHSNSHRFAFEEVVYTSCIKSRYQRLFLSLYEKEGVPLFILHHSWRNHIS